MAHPDTLLVFVNPYAAPLDQEGRPTAVYPWDPSHNPGRGWVGARLEARGDAIVPVYDEGPVAIPFLMASNHYRRGIAHGDLIAADAETLRRCGFPDDQFQNPQAVLANARARALAEWKAHHPGEVPAIESAQAVASSPPTPPAAAAAAKPPGDAPPAVQAKPEAPAADAPAPKKAAP
ncbi:hypothetical protein LZC95_19875 [Pendulispora brunnea]|uniref:Uncharacterized protein n=1 Tax=Pendulispora brunnea TaxID=2905690 RepID=A0ABZ2KP01_9BACT